MPEPSRNPHQNQICHGYFSDLAHGTRNGTAATTLKTGSKESGAAHSSARSSQSISISQSLMPVVNAQTLTWIDSRRSRVRRATSMPNEPSPCPETRRSSKCSSSSMPEPSKELDRYLFDFRLAEVLDNHGYVPKYRIGEGSSGKVILVKRLSDNAKFVCKLMDLSAAFASETVAAKKETKLLADLQHPYIVRYQESFHENGKLCIIMDYCKGGDVATRIENARKHQRSIPEEQVLLWLSQSLLALKYIHENHVLHRDLKPCNLFLTEGGNVQLGDFGLSTVLSATAAYATTQIGTPCYRSPEICQEQTYSWGSDVWALGCVLYELCALRVAFQATTSTGLVCKICNDPTPVLPSIYSKELRQIASDMLIRDPRRRPSAAALLLRPVVQAKLASFLSKERFDHYVQGAIQTVRQEEVVSIAEKLPKQPPGPSQYNSACSWTDAPYKDTDRTFKNGDRIECKSETQQEWLSGVRRILRSETKEAWVRPGTSRSITNEAGQDPCQSPSDSLPSVVPSWAKESVQIEPLSVESRHGFKERWRAAMTSR